MSFGVLINKQAMASKKTTTASKITKAVRIIIINVAIAFFALFFLFQIFVPSSALSLFGIRFYLISYTRSMEPVFEYNDLIMIDNTDFDDLKKNDIISFWSTNSDGTKIVVTHEIIEIETNKDGKTYITTKGCNLPLADFAPVTKDGADGTNQYIGRYVFKSSFLGNFIAFFRSVNGIIALIVNLAGLCVIWIFLEDGKPKKLNLPK